MPCSYAMQHRELCFHLSLLYDSAYLIALGIALSLCASRVVATVLIILLLLLLTTAKHGEDRGSGHGGSRGLSKTGGSVYTK